MRRRFGKSSWSDLTPEQRADIKRENALARREHPSQEARRLAKDILQLRETMALTQLGFGKLIGASESSIRRWERIKGHMPQPAMRKVLDELIAKHIKTKGRKKPTLDPSKFRP